jgi:hypothetical protein
MFMVMDDAGSLIWRFSKRLVVSSADADHGGSHHPPAQTPQVPPKIVSPAAE